MKNIFISVVQKCICVDFLLNALIKSNSYNCFTLLSTIKEENLRNIKIICYLYEFLYKDVLVLENISSIKLNKHYENEFNNLIELYFEIISDIKIFSKYSFNYTYIHLSSILINSYFGFISSMNYFCTMPYSDKNIRNNFSLLNAPKDTNINTNPDDITIDEIRNIAINCIEIFFDYSISTENLLDEGYETFFENDCENKFYQFFFKCEDRLFKVRILNKDISVFHLYQSIINEIEITPSMSNEDAKSFADTFLKEKLNDRFYDLQFDKDYLNIYSYMNIPEVYKFKYNFKDNKNKINFKKGIYISIDTRNIYVQELSLL